jgi:hypothetical protein
VAPFRARTSGAAYAAARSAFAEAWGAPPVEIGVGGSIGFLAPIVRTFPEAEVLITGVEDPDTRAHAPDESLHLADFERACLGEALLLHRLAGPDGPGQQSSSRECGSIRSQVGQSCSQSLPHESTRLGIPLAPSASARAHDSPMSSHAPSPEARITRR